MASKSVFARKDSKIIHIKEIPIELRGLKCNATCPLCNEPLIARMGDVKSHYFAHSNNSQCHFNNETALHLLAKEIISENKSLTLPPVSLKYYLKKMGHSEYKPIFIKEVKKIKYLGTDVYEYIPYRSNEEPDKVHLSDIKYYPLKESKRVDFDFVKLEVGYNGMIIDLMGEKNNSTLAIEIMVTHSVDNGKKQLLRKFNLATIEIDLSRYLEMNMEDFNREEFKDNLLHSYENINWLVIKDEIKEVLGAEVLLNEKYTRLKEAALIKSEEDMKQKAIKAQEEMRKKLIEDNKHNELLKYYNDKLKLFYEKKYKDIENRYFIKKEKEIQSSLINTMSKSERFQKSYIDKFIPAANLYFNCDFKTWQSIIFYKFIFSRRIGTTFTVYDIISYFKHSEETKEYFDRKFYIIASEVEEVRELSKIIFDYLEYLRGIGIIRGEVATNWYSYYDLRFSVNR